MFANQIDQTRMTELRRQADAYRLARAARHSARRREPAPDPRSRWIRAA